ncbi:MAG: PLP-dependent transferase, partial [Actinobacteria bacterium]|nr:PLP-dependent transferase [Actinomycetota bacterium]
MTERRRGFATRAIHAAAAPPIDQDTPSVPIYQTATYRFDSSQDYADTIAFQRPGYTYTRGYGNPTVEAFEAQVASLEGTETAFGFASGMAAVHTVVTSLVGSGDRIVAGRQLYGGAYALFTKVLPRFGVQTDLVDPRDHAAVAAKLPGAKLLYLETIANPAMAVADLPALGRLAADAGVPAVVDNTFASPYLCTPAAHGFAYVLHSATKYLGGHHDLTGGIVCCDSEARAGLRTTVIDTGGTMGPFDAWLAMRGTMTLPLRMLRHTASAQALAESLQAHPKV